MMATSSSAAAGFAADFFSRRCWRTSADSFFSDLRFSVRSAAFAFFTIRDESKSEQARMAQKY
jgi:hypothetical protein